jgi:hypothetical protein
MFCDCDQRRVQNCPLRAAGNIPCEQQPEMIRKADLADEFQG